MYFFCQSQTLQLFPLHHVSQELQLSVIIISKSLRVSILCNILSFVTLSVLGTFKLFPRTKSPLPLVSSPWSYRWPTPRSHTRQLTRVFSPSSIHFSLIISVWQEDFHSIEIPFGDTNYPSNSMATLRLWLASFSDHKTCPLGLFFCFQYSRDI